jgi:glycosyltransferase involved in cell wall biosynthesis
MKKIIFASGDFPLFGGAATNIYALTKWLNSTEDFKAIAVINYSLELSLDKLDPHSTGYVYHIQNWKQENIKNDIIKLLNGEPDTIYIKKWIIGHYLKLLFPNSTFLYILSSVISSEYDWKNKDKTSLYTEAIIPKCIRDLTYTDKIIANSKISQSILLNFNKNTDVNIAYTSFIINNGKHHSFLELNNNIDENWRSRKYDIGFASSCCNRNIKNIKLFINIIKNKQFNNKQKLIVGKNSEQYTSIENCACFDLLHHDDLMKQLKNIKLIIITSYYESLSNFMIESINSGCNILISNTIGGNEFIVDECIANTESEFLDKTSTLLEKQIKCLKNDFSYSEDRLMNDLFLK